MIHSTARPSTFRRSVAATLIASTTLLGIGLPTRAAVIGTEDAARSVPLSAVDASGHDRLAAALARADVVSILKARGVDPDAARARAAALTDAEAAELAQRFDQAPAGGINALAAVTLVFVVLLITDYLGFTKVFAFTSPIK